MSRWHAPADHDEQRDPGEDAPADDDRQDEPTLRDDVLRVLLDAGFTVVLRWPDVLTPIDPRYVMVGEEGAATGAVRVLWEGASKAWWLSHTERVAATAALRAAGLDAGSGGGVSVEVRGWLSDEERAREAQSEERTAA